MHACYTCKARSTAYALTPTSTAQRAATPSGDSQRVMPSRLPLASAAHFLEACTRSTACSSRCRWKLASLQADALLAHCSVVQDTLL